MARKIRLDQIGDYAEERFEVLVRTAVLETEGRLKKGSPTGEIGGGRLKNSWQFAENNGAGTTEPPQIVTGNSYLVFSDLPYTEPVITGRIASLPPSWKGKWRSRNGQIEENYHLTISKDMQNWIEARSNDR